MGDLPESFPNPARACCSSFSRAVLLQAVTIAVRVAHKLNDPSLVREPVEKGRGHFVILECVIMPLSFIVVLVEAILGAG